MVLANAIHESLPYIDAEPTPSERAAAQTLITNELSTLETTPQHPSLPALPPQTFTPTIEAEFSRIALKQPLDAIDLSRYEAPDPPPPESNSTVLRDALASARTAHTYLAARAQHLALLDNWGKNAWLVANWQLESLLRALERDLVDAKRDVDRLALERKRSQDDVAGEMRGLEEAWRKGVAAVLETEIAVEKLRGEIRERMRV